MGQNKYVQVLTRILYAGAMGMTLSVAVSSPTAAETAPGAVAHVQSPAQRIAAIRAAASDIPRSDVVMESSFDSTHVKAHDKTQQPAHR